MVSVSTRLSLWDRRDRLSVMKTERVILCVQCMQILTNCELVWEWVVRIEKVCESDCVSLGREPWSCGYVRQLMSERLWVQIPGLYEMSFFTLICCKNCIVCFKRPKINEKEAFVGPFFKKRLCDQDRERDEVCIERRKDLGRFSINVKAIFEAIFQRHFPGQISTSFCQITFRHFIIFSHPELHRYPPTYHSARGKYLSRKTDRPGFVTARGRPLSWTRNGWFC